MISNRIKSALPIRKASGAVGRPVDEHCIDNQKADIISYIENGFDIREVAIFTNCDCQTLSKWLVQNKGDRDVQRALIKALIKESGRPGIGMTQRRYI